MLRSVSVPFLFFGLCAAVFFAFVLWYANKVFLGLGDPSLITGYLLLSLMLLLWAFNLRKRLSMLPIGRASLWLALHVVVGILALALFWLHAGKFWPTGLYEQLLAGVFYVVSLSGFFGFALQKILPRRLTQTGIEVIYDRIPSEIADIRENVENIVLECTEKTGSDTVAQHYVETLFWFFQRPRFKVSHLVGGDAASHWLRGTGSAARRYLNDSERQYFDQIIELGQIKSMIDRHFVCQGIMKKWLFVHVPLSVAVIVLAFWHLLLVNVYAV